MPKKILVVLTATEKYPNLNRATGVWLGEAVHFVEKVERAGFAVDYVTPAGGYTPIDPHSLAMAEPIDWEWYHNRQFMNRLGATLKPSDVNPGDYAAIYFVGGHGVLWDFPDNADFQQLSRKIYENGSASQGVLPCKQCHGDAAEGAAGFPRLAGLNAKYVYSQLQAFRTPLRPHGVLMKNETRALTETQLRELAAYVGSR